MSDEQAIRDLVARWLAASKAGDLDTVLSLMADDVLFMVAGQEPFGKAAFAAASVLAADIRADGVLGHADGSNPYGTNAGAPPPPAPPPEQE